MSRAGFGDVFLLPASLILDVSQDSVPWHWWYFRHAKRDGLVYVDAVEPEVPTGNATDEPATRRRDCGLYVEQSG
jgi:hypothetical protein